MASEKRLIDANNLMEQVKAIHKAVDTSEINTDYDTGFHSATSQVQGLIAYMPTVDAVEVVRCKDCRWARPQDHREPTDTPKQMIICQCFMNHHIPAPWGARLAVNPEHFCSYGERRD